MSETAKATDPQRAPSRRFSAVPLAAAWAKKIPGNAFRVLIAICASSYPAGKAKMGVTELARRTGIDRDKVSAAVRRLENAELVVVERCQGRSSTYHVAYGTNGFPAVVSPDRGTVPQAGDGDDGEGCPPTRGPGVPQAGVKVSPDRGTKQTLQQNDEQTREHTPSLSLGERDATRPALRIVASEGESLTTEPAAEPILTPESEPAETAPRAAKGSKLKLHPAEMGAAFAEFWPVYPRRVARGAAEQAYSKAVKGGATPAAILLGCRRFAEQVARDRTDPQYIPHAATWLNAKRWDDEIEAAALPKFKEPWLAEFYGAVLAREGAAAAAEILPALMRRDNLTGIYAVAFEMESGVSREAARAYIAESSSGIVPAHDGPELVLEAEHAGAA